MREEVLVAARGGYATCSGGTAAERAGPALAALAAQGGEEEEDEEEAAAPPAGTPVGSPPLSPVHFLSLGAEPGQAPAPAAGDLSFASEGTGDAELPAAFKEGTGDAELPAAFKEGIGDAELLFLWEAAARGEGGCAPAGLEAPELYGRFVDSAAHSGWGRGADSPVVGARGAAAPGDTQLPWAAGHHSPTVRGEAGGHKPRVGEDTPEWTAIAPERVSPLGRLAGTPAPEGHDGVGPPQDEGAGPPQHGPLFLGPDGELFHAAELLAPPGWRAALALRLAGGGLRRFEVDLEAQVRPSSPSRSSPAFGILRK